MATKQKLTGKNIPAKGTTTEIKGARTRVKAADTKGGKPGSARANQSAGYAKSDTISSVKNSTTGTAHVIIAAEGQQSILIPANRFTGLLQKAAVVGASYAAVAELWAEQQKNPPKAGLAKGLDARSAPHSAKAVADAAGKGNPAKAPAKPAAAKKEARKAERAAKAAPKGDDTRKITLAKKDFTFGGEGTERRASWDKCAAVIKAKGTVSDYIAKGGKAKYLPRWVSAGGIKLG